MNCRGGEKGQGGRGRGQEQGAGAGGGSRGQGQGAESWCWMEGTRSTSYVNNDLHKHTPRNVTVYSVLTIAML